MTSWTSISEVIFMKGLVLAGESDSPLYQIAMNQNYKYLTNLLERR
jgi:hypothetical protein